VITVYNKLVRNNIPDIIEQSGKKAIYRTLSYDEFQQALKVKLVEEANELLNAKTPEEELEELVDIYEVLGFITRDKAVVIEAAAEKRNTKGWFNKRIFLESVEE
jgi:predicted house-cleaning noncanonical NTP pyrophosphatase (MazG superfamily)